MITFHTTSEERDQTEKARQLQELSGIGGAGGCHCYVFLHLGRASTSSIQVLWSTCRVTVAHSQQHCPEPILAQKREQVESTGCYHMHPSSPPRSAAAGQASTPGASKHLLGSNQPAVSTWHTAHTDFLLHKTTFFTTNERDL